MTQNNNTMIENFLKELESNPTSMNMPLMFSTLLNLAMKVERDNALAAMPYERTSNRQGSRNGFKNKTVKTRMGEIDFNVPQVRGG